MMMIVMITEDDDDDDDDDGGDGDRAFLRSFGSRVHTPSIDCILGAMSSSTPSPAPPPTTQSVWMYKQDFEGLFQGKSALLHSAQTREKCGQTQILMHGVPTTLEWDESDIEAAP